jgi:hypothetical protein
MLFRKIIDIYSKNYKKSINIVRAQKKWAAFFVENRLFIIVGVYKFIEYSKRIRTFSEVAKRCGLKIIGFYV